MDRRSRLVIKSALSLIITILLTILRIQVQNRPGNAALISKVVDAEKDVNDMLRDWAEMRKI